MLSARTVDSPLVWDAMAPMWLDYNDVVVVQIQAETRVSQAISASITPSWNVMPV